MHIKQEMVDFVINLLKTKIPKTYYYHNVGHTLYVVDNVVKIGNAENCTDNEIELLKVAALWHDTGYINIYTGHEAESCKLSRKYLPGYGYHENDIEKICGMIMATKIPN
ncbi:MAG TPA: HD domain-containing protein, partial [Ferruginibacter sp.]|nr:HD domain-containing protein [Ferruginibacter sp.]